MQTLLSHFNKKSLSKFVPILITDIDGVLVRGPTPIPTTLEALNLIKQHKIPFACLTNGGGNLERIKAEKLNKIFKLEDYFTGEYMFMNHSPLKPEILKHSKAGEWILVSGSLQIQDILHDIGVTNYVTCDEFYTLFLQNHEEDLKQIRFEEQQTFPSFKRRHLTVDEVHQKIVKRTGRVTLPKFQEWVSQIGAIFSMNDISPYETTLEVISLITRIKKITKQTLPPYFAAQNDIIWASVYKRPRMAFGPFNRILKDYCERNDLDLKQTHYGKPEEKAFGFVEQTMRQRVKDGDQGYFFMVGDNPKADIRGANRVGWVSFLTQTGIHPTSENDPQDPGTVVVQDFLEAVKLIVEMKKQLS